MLSDTRKGILYLLLDEPRSLTDIRVHFGVKSSSVIPRLKDLLQINLIVKEDGKYRLTTKGRIVAKKLREMDSLENVVERAGAFFNSHDIGPIPCSLMDRIGDLENCEVITNGLEHITATHDEIYQKLPKAKKALGISPAFDTRYPGVYLGLAKLGIPVSLVITENIFRKVESDYKKFLEEYLRHPNASMYVIEEARLAMVTTDDFLSLYLYDTDGTLDPMSCFVCFGEAAGNWGRDLFEEYRQKARRIEGR